MKILGTVLTLVAASCVLSMPGIAQAMPKSEGEGKGTIGVASMTLRDSRIYGPACGTGWRSDSFGRGIRDQMLSRRDGAQFELSDLKCYELGKQYAESVVRTASQGKSSCEQAFGAGFKQGIIASSRNVGTACYSLGYSAGMAELRIAARSGNVQVTGKDCREMYCKGASDRVPNSSAWMPSGLDLREQSCYQQGYFEASISRFGCP
jgi:hypothetical protein